MRRALVLLTAVGLLATSACASGTGGTPTPDKKTTKSSTSHAPFHGVRLDDGEVVKVDKLDGIRLGSPDDGRLRNYGVDVDVVDFGTGDVVDSGTDGEYGAGEDSTVLAFRLRVTTFADEPKVKATVSVDGKQRSLPDFEYALGEPGTDQTIQYLVGVPEDRREVELELKYADFAQQFDLLEGKRTGTQPDILYRSDDEPSVYIENLTPAKLPVTNEDDEAGAYVIGVTRAELTNFAPDLGDVPGADDKAWLVLTYEPTGEGVLEYNPSAIACNLPFAAFTLGDGTSTYPVVDKHSTMKEFASEHTLAFEVPADLSDATLTVKAPSFQCSNGGIKSTMTAAGEARVTMTLPKD
jgi:hypothetical protein